MPELRRHQVPGGPGRLPGRHRRRAASKSGNIGAIGGIGRLRPVRPLHPGLRARRQVGQPRHQGRRPRGSRPATSPRRSTTRPAARRSASSSSHQNAGIDVLFQVAGKTGNGVLEAACAAGINGIGVDVDQYLSYAGTPQPCIVTSAEKHLSVTVSKSIQQIAAQDRQGRPASSSTRPTTASASRPFYEAASQAPGRHPDQARRGTRGHEGRHPRDLPAGARLRQTPAPNPIGPLTLSRTPERVDRAGRPARSLSASCRSTRADERTDRHRTSSPRSAHPRSRCAASPSATRASSPTTASTSTSARARSTPCSARTAPARPR